MFKSDPYLDLVNSKGFPRDTKVNLCDTCVCGGYSPECPDEVEFGDGYGNDNIISCVGYEEEK
jgi:hypothetical protein